MDMYEKSIFEKGLKFIPTPQEVNKEALIHGGKQLAKNIKLAYFFHSKSNNVKNCPKMFVPKSSWEPLIAIYLKIFDLNWRT